MALSCLKVGNDFVFYVLSSDLPKYMKEVLGFPVRDVGLYSSIPYLLMWLVSITSGFICDHLISKNYVTVTQARKLFAALGRYIKESLEINVINNVLMFYYRKCISCNFYCRCFLCRMQ